MYNNTRSRVRVNNTYSDEFGVKVGVHQGSVLSPLLFVIVLKTLSFEFRTGTPWELLYANDLVISAETEEGLKMKLNKWKTEMEAKGLRVNTGKIKIMVSGVNLQTLKDSGKYPCNVCRKGVSSNSIYCAGCSHWVHKKCSGVIGSLKSNPDCCCSRCKVLLFQLTGDLIIIGFLCTIKNWMLLIRSAPWRYDRCWGRLRFECYYKNSICVGQVPGTLANINLTCPFIHITRGQIYSMYIHTVLYAGECWAPNVNDLLKLQCNDRAMIWWTCNVQLKDHISSDSLLRKLGINNRQTLL